jgi:alanine dehydrogenase
MLKIGIVKTSLKANERRVPVYPEHLPWIPGDVRKHLIFEKDYGEDYGYKDEFFIEKCGGMLKRKELFECCDVIVLPKPVVEDLKIMRKNQVLWAGHIVYSNGILLRKRSSGI